MKPEGPARLEIRPRPLPNLTRSIAAAATLAIDGIVSMLLIRVYSSRITLLNLVISRVDVPRAPLLANDEAVAWGSRIHLVISAATGIAFLIWFYRAHKNLLSFREPPLLYTAAQAVWSFFIPLVNFVRPLYVMRELWQATEPSLPPFAKRSYISASVFPVVYYWWGLFLAHNFLSGLALRPLLSARSPEAFRRNAELLRTSYQLSVLGSLAAILLIVLIQRRQENLANQLRQGTAA